jgi:DNA-directed RNA polymerase specialized sigma24 family protein
MDLESLLRAARDREPNAWNVLVPPLFERLRAYFLRDFQTSDAVELAQHTITILIDDLPGFRPRKTLVRWVFGIARNVARQQHKARARAKNLARLAARLTPSPGTSPTARMHRDQIIAALQEEIAKLPAHYRRTIENELIEGDIEVFARREKIERSTVRSRRLRALGLLRERLLVRWPAESESPSSPPSESTSSKV